MHIAGFEIKLGPHPDDDHFKLSSDDKEFGFMESKTW